jgi:pimeloyl-ACP methyl ester carboxylesterase
MNELLFTGETSADGVRERDFTLGELPGVLWSPESAESGAERAPLVLLGHGGGMHKKHRAMLGRASRLVTGGGFHVAVIDAPGHGDRPRNEHDQSEVAAMYAARRAGGSDAAIIIRYNADLAKRAVPEYQTTLDALQRLPEIGPEGPVGYCGIGIGTAIGIPLVAQEPRITAAAFGPHWPDALAEYARRITVPIEFYLQWDDEHIPRQDGLALFDAFASREKSLHANAGGHRDLPRFEADNTVHFLLRHLA